MYLKIVVDRALMDSSNAITFNSILLSDSYYQNNPVITHATGKKKLTTTSFSYRMFCKHEPILISLTL